jgi:hypothetical protein
MRNGEGGTVPSYNLQLLTDTTHGLVVNVDATTDAIDYRQLTPALQRCQTTLGQKPRQLVADGDYTNHASWDQEFQPSIATVELTMAQHGLLRPLGTAELSDGTLRYLLWIAALLTPRPPAVRAAPLRCMVLNEPYIVGKHVQDGLEVALIESIGELLC